VSFASAVVSLNVNRMGCQGEVFTRLMFWQSVERMKFAEQFVIVSVDGQCEVSLI